MLNFIAMISKSMKKETRIETLEMAVSLICKDMESNLFRALLKRKSSRLSILKIINTDIERNQVNIKNAKAQWMTEMESLQSKNCRKKESSQKIDERMILTAQV